MTTRTSIPAVETKIEDIQLLRGVAILLVLVMHWSLPNMITDKMPVDMFVPGWIGVELFFVISGFVVTQSLIHKDFNLIDFAIRRVFRLYPVLLVCLACVILINFVLTVGPTPQYAREIYIEDGYVLLQQCWAVLTGRYPDESGGSYMLGPLWSLGAEFRFYAFFVLYLAALKLVPFLRDHLLQGISVMALIVLAIGFAARVGWYFNWHSDLGDIVIGSKYEFMALGVLAAVHARVSDRLAALAGRYWPVFLLVPLICLSFGHDPNNLIYKGDMLESFGMIATALSFTLLVIAASRGMIVASLSPTRLTGLIHEIGDKSYAIYVFHFSTFVVAWGFYYLLNRTGVGGLWGWAVVQVVLSSAMLWFGSRFLYTYLEQPMIALGRRLALRTRGKTCF